MCFISVCLNCPGTLESLSVSQIRCNETRLLSSEDTCLSAVTQAKAGGWGVAGRGEGGVQKHLKEAAQRFDVHDGASLCIRNHFTWAGCFHYGSPPGREVIGQSSALVQTCGV